jgi:hypothetical protein
MIAFSNPSEDVAGSGVIGGKRFSRRGVEPSASDQHLTGCVDKRLNLPCNGICSVAVFMIILLSMPHRVWVCGDGAARTHYIGTGQGIIESAASMQVNAEIRKTGSGLFW